MSAVPSGGLAGELTRIARAPGPGQARYRLEFAEPRIVAGEVREIPRGSRRELKPGR